MGPEQILPPQVWVYQGIMAMKKYSTFSKSRIGAFASNGLVLYPEHLWSGEGAYPYVEM